MRKAAVGIIGGGAGGMTAAIRLASAGFPVTILEAQPRVGKKLLVTGSGRCNLTNLHAAPAFYHGDARLLSAVLTAFPPEKTLVFFQKLGLYTTTDAEGRVYPRSMTAASVLDALRLKCDESGVQTRTDMQVRAIQPIKNGFSVVCDTETFFFPVLLLACGSRAASPVDGYDLIQALGLTVNPPVPALCPIPVRGDSLRAVKGLRVHARVSLLADGHPAQDASGKLLSAAGEVQLADRALSGICVFDLSRWSNLWLKTGFIDGKRVRRLDVSLDLLPELADKTAFLRSLRQTLAARPAEDFLSGLLPKRLGQVLLKTVCPDALTVPAGTLPDAVIESLGRLLSAWTFEPSNIAPWNQAQAAAGGIAAEEIDPETLEARKYRGLYPIGEILDADGICGGFNLQWAWACAMVAARGIVEKFS